MSSMAADAMPAKSATACTATLLSALPPMSPLIVVPTLNSVQQAAASGSSPHAISVTGRTKTTPQARCLNFIVAPSLERQMCERRAARERHAVLHETSTREVDRSASAADLARDRGRGRDRGVDVLNRVA